MLMYSGFQTKIFNTNGIDIIIMAYTAPEYAT